MIREKERLKAERLEKIKSKMQEGTVIRTVIKTPTQRKKRIEELRDYLNSLGGLYFRGWDENGETIWSRPLVPEDDELYDLLREVEDDWEVI